MLRNAKKVLTGDDNAAYATRPTQTPPAIAVILKRISPRLWIGRHYFSDDHYAGMVLSHGGSHRFKASLAFVQHGRNIQDNPIHRLEGQVSEILSEAQSIIHTSTGTKVPIIKQEIPWEAITQE